MAIVTKKVCDAETCKVENGVTSFSFFIDRRADAAGSMKNVYRNFDLCSVHAALFFQNLLDNLDEKTPGLKALTMRALSDFKINTREG